MNCQQYNKEREELTRCFQNKNKEVPITKLLRINSDKEIQRLVNQYTNRRQNVI